MTQAGLEAFLADYGGPAVFAAVVVETFVSVLPLPPVTLAAGALLVPETATYGAALLSLAWRVALPAAVGTAIGGMGVYWIFWLGGRPLVERFGRWFGVRWADVERLQARLAKRRGLLLFSARAVPVLPTALVSAACGVLRTEPGPFFLWTLAGAFPRWLLVAWMGWAGKSASVAAFSKLFG